jgi:hypothetical protein
VYKITFILCVEGIYEANEIFVSCCVPYKDNSRRVHKKYPKPKTCLVPSTLDSRGSPYKAECKQKSRSRYKEQNGVSGWREGTLGRQGLRGAVSAMYGEDVVETHCATQCLVESSISSCPSAFPKRVGVLLRVHTTLNK